MATTSLVVADSARGYRVHRANCKRIPATALALPLDENTSEQALDTATAATCCKPRGVEEAIAAAKSVREVTVEVTAPVTTATPEEQVCTGACGQRLPIRRFPTKTNGGRGTECRKCRDARRAAARNG